MELKDRKIVLLAEDIYEDQELWYPYYRMKEAGAQVIIAGLTGTETYKSKFGYPARAEIAAGAVDIKSTDAVIIPGGYAPDKMRRHPAMLTLVRDVFEKGGVVAFICHAGWVPISAGIVRGRKVTSVSAIKDDLVNAGAEWLDQEVVVDGNLVSSRSPADLPAFCRAIIAALKG
jgi:protease I